MSRRAAATSKTRRNTVNVKTEDSIKTKKNTGRKTTAEELLLQIGSVNPVVEESVDQSDLMQVVFTAPNQDVHIQSRGAREESELCQLNETSEHDNGLAESMDGRSSTQEKAGKRKAEAIAAVKRKGVKRMQEICTNQGYVHVNSKLLTKDSLQKLTRLETVSAILPTISNPVDNEVACYPNLQPVTDIFNKTTIPSYPVLQLWKRQLQQHAEDSRCDGYYYIEVMGCRYDLECVNQMKSLLRARDIRTAVEKELEWFAGPLRKPKSVSQLPSSDSMKKFQDLVFRKKWDEILPEYMYSLTSDDFAKVCCDRWLSDDIIRWTLNLMNQQDTLCIYHNPHQNVQEFLEKGKQPPSALLVVFGVARSNDGVIFSSDTRSGCHHSFLYVINLDGHYKAVYGDSLGWPAPDCLHVVASMYTEKIFQFQSQRLVIGMCHDPNQKWTDLEHTCSGAACVRRFPLTAHGGISGVVILMMAALACFKRDFFHILIGINVSETSLPDADIRHLVCPSSNAKYLRRVLATWIADHQICVDYLIPRRFEDEDAGEDNGCEEVEEERTGDEDGVESDQRVNGATGGVSLGNNLDQGDISSKNVQSSTNLSQHGAISKSSYQSDTSIQTDHNPSASSITNHKCPDSKCNYKTNQVFNMKRHISRNHPNVSYTPPLAHNCPACPFCSNKPTDITKHVNAHHPGIKWMPPTLKRGPKSKGGPKRYRCPQCDYQSNSKHNINRHQQSCHETIRTLESSRMGKCQCFECGERLYKISDLRRHLSSKHAFIFKTETVTLNSYQEFEEWKASIEIAEGCSFTKTTGDKVIQGSKRTQYFQCNRSGMFRPNNTGKRRQKWQGSCKIQSNCTSTMVASILESGKVEVECVCTHYSHQIELQHVWEPKGCKRESAPKNVCNQAQGEIMKDVDNRYGRQHVLSNQEIPDIVDVYAMSAIQQGEVNDRLSMLSWIKRWESSSDPSPVLMHKIEGDSGGCDSAKLTGLKKDDFLLVIQSELQRRMMVKFCPNGLYCDSATVPISKFVLTTLQVVDDIGQALPVAWCLSNHGNTSTDAVMKIFFTKLKLVCGDLTPLWFMSLWLEQFCETWTSVFGPVSRCLLCPWSVEAAWIAMLKKTTGNVSVDYTRAHKLLKIMIEQTDEKVFEDHLQSLLDWLDVSAKRQEFKRYFLNQWVSRKQEWTYCSNKDDTFLPYAFMEPFYQRFHQKYSHGDSSECLDSCVFHLLKYAQDCMANRHISLTKGKPVIQGQDIQRRHDAGISMDQSCVRPCSEDSHRWDVVETNQSTYTVQESASVCKYPRCPISCLLCHICFHQYFCTCLDNLTSLTICKHIHLVHSTIHKGTDTAPVRDTRWLKDRIQSRVQRLLAAVNSTGDEHFAMLQELDSKLGVCSSLLDSRLLWGPTDFIRQRQEEGASQSAAGVGRKEKRRNSSGERSGLKKKVKQGEDGANGKVKEQKGVFSVVPSIASGPVIQNGTTQLSAATSTISARTAAPIHETMVTPAAQQVTSIQQQTHTDQQMNIPQPSTLTSKPSITSDSHTSQTMISHTELQTPQASGIVSYPSPRTMTSAIVEHPHPHHFTSMPHHQPIIHAPGSNSSLSPTQHPHLGVVSSYQSLRPILASQLSPGSSQQVHVDFHQAVRPLESQQLATMSDEQLSTLAGVASALFGDS